MPVQVDGSVNLGTIELLSEAGFERFIAGSAVFDEGDPKMNVEELKSLIV